MLNKNMTIDKTVPVPLYYQLKTLILNEIKEGNYKPGDMIPTEKEISEMFDLSRTTVRQAVIELVHEGWLYRVKSKGTFVAEQKIKQDFLNKLESFNDQIARIGKTPSTEVLDLRVIDPDPRQQEALRLSKGEKAIYLYRKRCADNEPIVTIKTCLPYTRCAFLLDGHDLVHERLYEILGQSADTAIVRIDRTVEAVEADEEDARLLDYQKGKPIQYIESIGCNASGDPIEFSISHYRGDKNTFEVTVYS